MSDEEVKPLTISWDQEYTLNAGELVSYLDTNEDIVQFIKEMDVEAEDWDVTLALYEHFSNLKEIHDKHVNSEHVTVE